MKCEQGCLLWNDPVSSQRFLSPEQDSTITAVTNGLYTCLALKSVAQFSGHATYLTMNYGRDSLHGIDLEYQKCPHHSWNWNVSAELWCGMHGIHSLGFLRRVCCFPFQMFQRWKCAPSHFTHLIYTHTHTLILLSFLLHWVKIHRRSLPVMRIFAFLPNGFEFPCIITICCHNNSVKTQIGGWGASWSLWKNWKRKIQCFW